jgi:hypothetical protein
MKIDYEHVHYLREALHLGVEFPQFKIIADEAQRERQAMSDALVKARVPRNPPEDQTPAPRSIPSTAHVPKPHEPAAGDAVPRRDL